MRKIYYTMLWGMGGDACINLINGLCGTRTKGISDLTWVKEGNLGLGSDDGPYWGGKRPPRASSVQDFSALFCRCCQGGGPAVWAACQPAICQSSLIVEPACLLGSKVGKILSGTSFELWLVRWPVCGSLIIDSRQKDSGRTLYKISSNFEKGFLNSGGLKVAQRGTRVHFSLQLRPSSHSQRHPVINHCFHTHCSASASSWLNFSIG